MFSRASLGLIRIKGPTGKYWWMVYVVFCSKCGVLILDGWMADTGLDGWKYKKHNHRRRRKNTENKSLNLITINFIKLLGIYRWYQPKKGGVQTNIPPPLVIQYYVIKLAKHEGSIPMSHRKWWTLHNNIKSLAPTV